MINNLFFYGLCIAVFLSALQIVIVRHDARSLFVELQYLEEVRDKLNEEIGRLQLEQSTWATDDRIDFIARTKLKMRESEEDSIVFISK